ncbi:unnamed protein product [Rotaria socialis]|uniref:Nuclear receptor domain-containing protein n=1 Tax=Rotaria socialis TaxID=392032 RepID=A0A821QFG2_9BILA|nr:unnamed protein product [Rotaria socialis]
MEYKRSVQSSEINIHTIKKNVSSEICQVCGEENVKSAYGVQSCASCKIFFRRNVNLDLNTNKCIFGDECQITIKARHTCRCCRLKKCLSVGMKKYLLRASHRAQGGIKKKLLKQKPTSSMIILYPLDLLNHDRSLLSVDQWSLLSNVNNVYDHANPIENIRYIINSQSVFPPKLRLKMASFYVMDFIHSMYSFVESFIKIVPEFSSMKINYRTTLMRRNIQNLGGFNCQFMMSQTNMLNDFAYSNSLSSTYGSWIFNGTVRIVQQFDLDQILLKLLLIALAFSTSSDVITFENNNCSYRTSNYSRSDNFIERRYLSINANTLSASAPEIANHADMIRTIVDETEHIIISLLI